MKEIQGEKDREMGEMKEEGEEVVKEEEGRVGKGDGGGDMAVVDSPSRLFQEQQPNLTPCQKMHTPHHCKS